MPTEPQNNSSSSTSSSSSSSDKPKKKRGLFNQAHLDAIEATRDVVRAYRKPEHKAALIARDVTEAEVNALETTTNLAEDAVTGGHGATVQKEQFTAEEKAERAALIAAIAVAQRGALRTFRSDQRARLGDYFIGEDLDTKITRLKTIAAAILDLIAPGANNAPPRDVLKGVKAADITKLTAALATFTAKDNAQADAQSSATGKRRTAAELIADMMTGKLDIQLAADQEWPWTTRQFDTIRDEFNLPRTRPMTE